MCVSRNGPFGPAVDRYFGYTVILSIYFNNKTAFVELRRSAVGIVNDFLEKRITAIFADMEDRKLIVIEENGVSVPGDFVRFIFFRNELVLSCRNSKGIRIVIFSAVNQCAPIGTESEIVYRC